MPYAASELREQQRSTWNRFSPGWKKHDDMVGKWLGPMGDALLESARVRAGMTVLDAATGTGEPGLTAARRVGSGKVIGTDISADMLAIAGDKAAAYGITNYETRLCDELPLPFTDGTFDAAVCRLGVMYFPDPAAAVRELARVVKAGGTVAVSVWAPPARNSWATAAGGVVSEKLGIPTPAPDAPGLFRCSVAGTLSGYLTASGLSQVNESEVAGVLRFSSPGEYWQFIADVVAPIAAALSRVDEPARSGARQAVLDAVRARYSAGPVELQWSSWVASGRK